MKHCRKKNEAVAIKHYTHSSQLPSAWNDFVPEGHFLQSSQLNVTEESALPDLSFLYVQVLLNDIPIIAAGFQLLSLNGKHLNDKQVTSLQHLGWQVFTSIIRPKLLVGGHLFRHDVESVYCAEGLSSFERYTYYKLAIEQALDITCADSVLLKDMPDQQAKYYQNYEPKYLMLRNDISMEMYVPSDWQDIHDYEAALKHKYTQRFRKTRQPWEELSIKELSANEVELRKQQLYDLYMQVTNHQKVRIGLLGTDFLSVMHKRNERLKIWGIFEGEQLIGFFSAWVYEQAFDMFYIGFDYEKNKEYNLYFNILFLAVEQAIAHKKQKLIMGRTALDAKARLGCKPKYLCTFLYVKNRFVRQRVMQTQNNITNDEGAWESRHPFGQAKH